MDGTERPVYLDHHATTPTDPRVVEAMLPYFTETFGNASSVDHSYGWEAAAALTRAREQVARALGAEAREVVFTSGATESNNLALRGALPGLKSRGNHVVSTAVEHRSVLDTLKRLARQGWDVTFVAPDRHGLVSVDAIAAALTDRTALVSVIAASNEVGTLNPIAAIGRLCRDRGIVFHTDATQAVGKVRVDVNEMGADLLSLSGHKLHGPKGIGALYVRRGGPDAVRLTPLFDGGHQERGLRAGTVAVPLAVGLGAACTLAVQEMAAETLRLRSLRDALHESLIARIDDLTLNGHPTERLPGNLNVSVAGVDGELLLGSLKRVAVSSGAACTSSRPEPSHVLMAMGLDESLARASLRFGLGRFTTRDEVELAAEHVADAVRRLRLVGLAPAAAQTSGI